MYVILGIPKEIVFSRVDRFRIGTLIWLGIVALLTLGAAWVGGNLFIVRRMEALVKTARRLAVGDLSVRTGLTSVAGEFGELASAFDPMAEVLEHRQGERERYEEASRESEGQFRRLAENAQDIVLRYRFLPSRGFEYVSPAATTITGFTPEEHYADPDLGLKIVHPDDVSAVKESTNKIFASKKGITRVYRLRHQETGEYRWMEDRVVAKLNDVGNVTGIFGVARDITDRWLTEEALKQSEARFRALAETAACVICIYQGEKLRYVNAAVEAISGYTREELRTNNFWDIIHPEYRDLIGEQGFRRQRGEPVPSRYEFKIIVKNGEERWVDLASGPIEFDGRPAILGTAFDITDRKRAEESLRASEEGYRDLVENSQDLICTHDLKGRILSANRVDMSLTEDDGYLILEVKDNGQGIKAPEIHAPESLGLLGMRERAAVLGGKVDISGSPGEGTTVSARFPLGRA